MELATKLLEGNDRTVLANRTEFLNFKKFSGLYKISFCLTRPDDQNTRLKNFVKRICNVKPRFWKTYSMGVQDRGLISGLLC